MIPKGIGDIRSLHTVNTRPGPMTEKDLMLKLYKLASQKANFQKKKEWAERQQFQAVRHLTDIQREIGRLRKRSLLPAAKAGNPEAEGKRKNWSEISLRY